MKAAKKAIPARTISAVSRGSIVGLSNCRQRSPTAQPILSYHSQRFVCRSEPCRAQGIQNTFKSAHDSRKKSFVRASAYHQMAPTTCSMYLSSRPGLSRRYTYQVTAINHNPSKTIVVNPGGINRHDQKTAMRTG
jgi:hypothetical protein